MRLWDTTTWALVGEHRGPEGVQRLAWSPGWDAAAAQSDSSCRRLGTRVNILVVESGQSEQLAGSRGLAWSPTGDRFAVGGVGTVRIFAPERPESRQTLTGLGDQVIAVDWSRTAGEAFAVSNQAGSLLVVEVETGRLVRRRPGREAGVEIR